MEIADDFDDFDDLPPLDDFDDDLETEVYVPPPAPLPPPVAHAPEHPFPPPPAPAPPPPPPVARSAPDTSFTDQLRLQTIKGFGKAAIPRNAPPEWEGKVIADLERFVTTTQFPADLSYLKASEIVQARVGEVLRPWREAEDKAARQKKAREEADRRRIVLIAHGNEYARGQTSDWDWSASNEARDEVKKVLEREVKHDWTEREVEDEVDEVLDEWDDEEDGEDEWDDEDDERDG